MSLRAEIVAMLNGLLDSEEVSFKRKYEALRLLKQIELPIAKHYIIEQELKLEVAEIEKGKA